MHRRTFLVLAAAAPVAFLPACGSDGTTLPPAASIDGEDTDPTDPPSVPDTTPPTTEQPAVTEAPSDVDQPVDATGTPILTLTSEGGFTTREYAFQNPASIIVTDDGRVITLDQNPATDALVPQHEIRSISPDGIIALRAALDEAGLFADVDYARDDFLADAATTTLVVVADDGSEYRHEAYALATGGGLPGDPASNESDPARVSLARVVSSLVGDLESVVGADTLGPSSPWVPSVLQITVESSPAVDTGSDAPVVDWPDSADVHLDDERFGDFFGCAEVADPATVGALLSARAPTLFRDTRADTVDDVFRVTARPAYPGRTCDA